MKAIAYSIQAFEKESLILANGKKHDLTLISNELNEKTIQFSVGKEAVVVSMDDLLPTSILNVLWEKGVKYIIVRGNSTSNVDVLSATKIGFKTAYVPGEDQSASTIAQQVIHFLHAWEEGKCVGLGCCCDKILTPNNTEKSV